ncbi:MAG: hypothetical protein R8M14_04550 [Ghiorsea sp.]
MNSPALNFIAEAALKQQAKRIIMFQPQAHPLWVALRQQVDVFSNI